MSDSFSHFDPETGASRMVDVGSKPSTSRTATASGRVRLQPATVQKIQNQQVGKGSVLEVARLAGIMAAKKTGELVPLCHPLGLDRLDVNFDVHDDGIAIEATAAVHGRTGVEMEAMTAVSVAALTIYDMCKAVDRGMVIEHVRLESKTGGQSGDFRRKDK